MVAFRGDFVHGGTSYARHHTRLFMGLLWPMTWKLLILLVWKRKRSFHLPISRECLAGPRPVPRSLGVFLKQVKWERKRRQLSSILSRLVYLMYLIMSLVSI
jgi:hypothetical protein